MYKKLMFSVLLVALWGCSDLSDSLDYHKEQLSSKDDLEEKKCDSRNEGEEVIVSEDGSLVFVCKNGSWLEVEDVEQVESSSSAKPKSSSSRGKDNSDDEGDLDPEEDSSSSVEQPSSSAKGEQTPTAIPDEDFGTCSVTTGSSTVEKGAPVNFKFSFAPGSDYSIAQLTNSTFEWHFDAAKAVSDGLGNKANSPGITFAVSGDQDVSVTVTVDGYSRTIPCPVHVNGAKISGCTCSAAASSVDYTMTATADWSVSGCTSPAGGLLTYEWDGVAGTSEYSKLLSSEDVGINTPTLVVRNEDNSAERIECPSVKVTKGPEYAIREYGDKIQIPGPGVYSIEIGDGINYGTCIASVNSNGPVSGTLEGVQFSGQYYTSIMGLPASACNGTVVLVIKSGTDITFEARFF